MSATTAIGAPRTTAPSPLLITVLGLASAFTPFGADAYLPGLVPIARDLRAGVTGVQLTFSAFLLGLAVGHLALGPLSDRYGRRGPLLACLAVCTVAGAACALAPTVGVLIGARFVQGLAGSAGIVIGRAVVSDIAHGRQAARAFAVLMGVLAIAPIVAPLAGGVLIETTGWRGVFAALALLSLLMFLAVLIALPETLPAHRRTAASAHPRAARALLRDPGYVAPALAFTLGFGALVAYLAASPFFLRDLLGLSTAPLALTLALNALGLVLVATAGTRLAYRFRTLRPAQAGLAVLLVAAAVLGALAATGGLTVATCLPLLLVAAASLGLVLGNTCAVALGRAPHVAVTASALMATVQFTFAAIVAPLTGLRGDRDAVPMALIMGACAVLALLALVLAADATGMTGSERTETLGIGIRSCEPPR
ncbi:multidrug effflux MFS transporter [Sphaerisporangium perillae]|uniref:multidrug effflux MFS transporter n=1 Tax=Sphaerisporangium perillae TaxID=2935860 RepID=UPI00200C1FAA|nr:multidrug effflux MFS transporter [Sphaerisporangium perillae]